VETYLIYHPESINHVMQEHARNYNKDVFTYQMFKPLLGRGLLINDGQSWLHQRRLMQPAFHRKRLATYGTFMTNATVAMLERWLARSEGGMPLNIPEEMIRLTLQIVGQTFFDLDLGQETSLIGPAVTTALGLLGEYVYRPFPPISVPIPLTSLFCLFSPCLSPSAHPSSDGFAGDDSGAPREVRCLCVT
jgi:cytochrome P450